MCIIYIYIHTHVTCICICICVYQRLLSFGYLKSSTGAYTGAPAASQQLSITRTSMEVTRSPPQKQYETAERARNATVHLCIPNELQAKRSSYSTFTVFEWKGGPSNILKHCKAMPKSKPYYYDRFAKFRFMRYRYTYESFIYIYTYIHTYKRYNIKERVEKRGHSRRKGFALRRPLDLWPFVSSRASWAGHGSKMKLTT